MRNGKRFGVVPRPEAPRPGGGGEGAGLDPRLAERLLDEFTAAALPAALKHALECRAQNAALMAASYALEAARAVIVRRAEHLALLRGELGQ